VTRQTVTGSLRAPPLVKDIETTTLYTQVADGQLDAVQVSHNTMNMYTYVNLAVVKAPAVM
jgi:hypothetical protein